MRPVGDTLFARLALVMGLLALVPSWAAAQSESVEYYALDAIGSVRVVFDANGAILGRMDYGPFGQELFAGTTLPSQRFAGLFRDGEAGLDHAGARSYQSRTGRFTRPDPIYAGLFDPQQWNRYAYGRNAPLTFVDPDGLLIRSTSTPGCSTHPSYCGGGVDPSATFASWSGELRDFRPADRQPGSRAGARSGSRGSGDPEAPPAEQSPAVQAAVLLGQAVGEIAQCASKSANNWSIASMAGVPADNFLGQTVLGNDFAGLSDLVTGPDRLGQIPATLTGLAIQKGLEKGGAAAMNARVGPKNLLEVRVDSSWNAYGHHAFAEKLGKTALGGVLRVGAKFVLAAKTVYDGGAYVVSGVACLAAGPK